MKTYLVGGAVRDQLLGLTVTDRDWVVVGATPEQLLAQGYQQAGRDFPVFLHPKTHEEYALARTERKSGPGYHGFETRFAPDVTLEQDLLRRDLTINAMARAHNGELIDPWGGKQDLCARQLRHVSAAFSEDPLRVLRIARFAARFAGLGFQIAPPTFALMQQMVASGELSCLTRERVWKETEKALAGPQPEVYFEVLRACGALASWFPELDRLFTIYASPHQVSLDLGHLSLQSLASASQLTESVPLRFAVLFHLIHQTSDADDAASAQLKPDIEQLCLRIAAPNSCRDLLKVIALQYRHLMQIQLLTAERLVQLFDEIDAWRRPERVEELALAVQAIAQADSSQQPEGFLKQKFIDAFHKVQEVAVAPIIAAGFKGSAVRDELTKRRIQALS